MTQDVLVTLIAFATAAILVARWWRRRKRAEPACANCESSPSKTKPVAAEVKPVAFFGAAKRK